MASASDGAFNKNNFEVHSSIQEIVDRYDGFILDQFGVLHNGQQGLEGAPACVHKLKALGKRLIILSNSSSSAESCKAKLPDFGFDPDAFVGAVTSGHESGKFIKDSYAGKKALFFTWKTPITPSPLRFLELCGNIEITDQPAEADVVILHGVDVLRGPGCDGEATEQSLGDFLNTGNMQLFDPILEQCSKDHLPMVCANPDFIVVKPDGSIGHMPGKIAERYQIKFGGSVKSFGKPSREHFEACLRDLDLPKDRVVHVGDSLLHDIAGANDSGIDSILVTGGIHNQDLLGCIDPKAMPDRTVLAALFAKYSTRPTHVLPMFRF